MRDAQDGLTQLGHRPTEAGTHAQRQIRSISRSPLRMLLAVSVLEGKDQRAPQRAGGSVILCRAALPYRLARSGKVWERRTEIVATHHFIQRGDLDDTFAVAERPIRDSNDPVHRAR